jgi:hypothetical protein
LLKKIFLYFFNHFLFSLGYLIFNFRKTNLSFFFGFIFIFLKLLFIYYFNLKNGL